MHRADIIEAAGKIPILSGILRRWADRYDEGSIVTIGSGHAKGMRWQRSHRYVSGYWLGHYELDMQDALGRELQIGDGFLDIGANAGFFSLVACAKVGPTGWCVSVDPDPDNCKSMQSQRSLNSIQNWNILEQAVADKPGRAKFARASAGSPMAHLLGTSGEAELDVAVTTIDAICDQFGKPALIKLDVEGAEVRALEGAARTLRDLRPTWLIEIHSSELKAEVSRILGAASYESVMLDRVEDPNSDPMPQHIIARPK